MALHGNQYVFGTEPSNWNRSSHMNGGVSRQVRIESSAKTNVRSCSRTPCTCCGAYMGSALNRREPKRLPGPRGPNMKFLPSSAYVLMSFRASTEGINDSIARTGCRMVGIIHLK